MPKTIDGYPVGIEPEDTTGMRSGSEGSTGGAFGILVGPVEWGGSLVSHIKGSTGLPAYGTKQRDEILRASVLVNGMWASAVMMAITKTVGLGYTLTDAEDSQRRLSYSKDLIDSFDGAYTKGLARGMRDWLTTNAGQFIGLVRSGSRLTGLLHLDSLRCTPTGWVEYPVLYASPKGSWHLMPADDVIQLNDQPTASDGWAPYGQCAADRAWDKIITLTGVETYFREKITGARNLAIHFVTGVSYEQLNDALASTTEAQTRRGFVIYRGSTLIPMINMAAEPRVVTIPLAEVPDGYIVNDERRDAYLVFSNATGLFSGELQPLSGQGLGTGTQSIVLEQAAEGRGNYYRKSFAEALNLRVLPASTTIVILPNDLADQKGKAEVFKTQADAVVALVGAGIVSSQQALNILVDNQVIAKEYLNQDVTPGGTVTDEQKVILTSDQAPDGVSEGVRAMQERRAAAIGNRESPDKGILGYHIETGVVSRNEARAALGLPPEDETQSERLRRLQASLSAVKAATEAGLGLNDALDLVGLKLPSDDPNAAAPSSVPALPPPSPSTTTKAGRDLTAEADALIDDEWAAALDWAKQAKQA